MKTKKVTKEIMVSVRVTCANCDGVMALMSFIEQDEYIQNGSERSYRWTAQPHVCRKPAGSGVSRNGPLRDDDPVPVDDD
jgi:hypothetical protein